MDGLFVTAIAAMLTVTIGSWVVALRISFREEQRMKWYMESHTIIDTLDAREVLFLRIEPDSRGHELRYTMTAKTVAGEVHSRQIAPPHIPFDEIDGMMRHQLAEAMVEALPRQFVMSSGVSGSDRSSMLGPVRGAGFEEYVEVRI